MASDRWRDVSRLYHATMAQPADARDAFLAQACTDEALRQEVQALLAQPLSAPGFLEPGAFGAAVLALGGERTMTGSIGPYEIQGLLGAGGMGEVYRASDPRLGRDVAIKILPREFTNDDSRLARFEREARILAALNHPNIGAIYGLESGPGGDDERTRALILELVEGETLEDRVAQGPLTFHDALTVATQVAEALEAAHAKGIVHRDLKPANIKITGGGVVKVLDFGLAKITPDHEAGTAEGPSRDGLIIGTVAYMSPEQTRGRDVDARSDIWAFGCILYEMLVGHPAFAGATATDTLAAIVDRDPDWSALPQSTRPSIRRLLKRCLQKEARHRLHAIADARLDIEEALTETLDQSSDAGAPEASTSKRSKALWATAAIVTLIAAVALRDRLALDPESRMVTRFTAALPADLLLPAVARDGSRFAFVVKQGNERGEKIYLRRMDQSEATPIPGTGNATAVAFSPDGEWITFVARPGTQSQLKKVHIASGAVQTLVEDAGIPPGIPVRWGEDNQIYFTSADRLLRVASEGGEPETLVATNSKDAIERIFAPQPLPGGKGVLVTLWTTAGVDFRHESHIAVVNVETGQTKVLLEAAGIAHYAPTSTDQGTGHIVYERNGSLLAVPFDANRLVLKGSPARVLEGVGSFGNSPAFALSDSGTLVYGTGSAGVEAADTLVWVDRRGNELPISAPPLRYSAPRLSPDGGRVALVVGDGRASRAGLGVYDLARANLTRLTSEGNSFSPIWTPDGKRLIYLSRRALTDNSLTSAVASLPADGSAPPLALLRGDVEPKAITADGRVLLLRQSAPNAWFAQVMANGLPSPSDQLHPFLESMAAGGNVSFSPDGRWVAYDSTDSGGAHVYVEAFPGPGGRWQISIDRGWGPRWSHSGRELFYRDGDKMMVVQVETSPTFRVATPTKLFEARYTAAYDASFDLAPDDQRFLMIKSNAAETVRTLHVVLNWFEELKEH